MEVGIYGCIDERSENMAADRKKKIQKKIKKMLAHPVVAPVGTAMILGIYATVSGFLKLPSMVNELSVNIEKMSGRLGTVESRLTKLETQVEGLDSSLESLEERVGRLENYHMQVAAVAQVTEPMRYSKSESSIAELSCDRNGIIAIDINTKKEYTCDDLENENVILTYEENENDIVFYGRYNENNHWDGKCLINSYENGKLVAVMEANYDNGKMLAYRQVSTYKKTNEIELWSVSNRVLEGDSNTGITETFVKRDDYNKEFQVLDYNALVWVDDIKAEVCKTREGYYYGQTSNGYYNDDTGKAYSVKFFEDGTVKLVYNGKFRNGQFDDNTGSAWQIAREEDTNYMYYKGEFKNGVANEKVTKDNFKNNLTQEEIDNYIKSSNIEFGCKLVWSLQKL